MVLSVIQWCLETRDQQSQAQAMLCFMIDHNFLFCSIYQFYIKTDSRKKMPNFVHMDIFCWGKNFTFKSTFVNLGCSKEPLKRINQSKKHMKLQNLFHMGEIQSGADVAERLSQNTWTGP